MKKKNILIIAGMILIFVGALLPSVRIAQENISFIKENGSLIIILVAATFILLKLNQEKLIVIPSIISIYIIIKFIIDNNSRLNEIKQLYNCYAAFQYGIIVMILGNLIILTILTMEILKNINFKTKTKELKEKIENSKEIVIKNIQNIKEKLNYDHIIEKISINKKVSYETSKDGKISFKKITVKCDKPAKKKLTLKERINEIKIKLLQKKILKRKLSISRYKDEEINTPKTYNIPVIDIQKWTNSDICCSNCGATVHTTSEYCFLCDCKIKLKNETKQTS